MRPPLPGAGHLARVVTSDLLPQALRQGYELPDGRVVRAQASAPRRAVRLARPPVPDRWACWPHLAVALDRLR